MRRSRLFRVLTLSQSRKMVRGLVMVVVVLAGLVAIAVPGVRWLTTEQGRPGAEAESACYPLREPCRWQTPAGEATVTMAPLEGDELQLNVTLPGAPDRLMVVLTGESMYMGEYPFLLEKTREPNEFRASFVPPFCSTGDDMIWRVNLRAGPEPLAVPFRLVFSH